MASNVWAMDSNNNKKFSLPLHLCVKSPPSTQHSETSNQRPANRFFSHDFRPGLYISPGTTVRQPLVRKQRGEEHRSTVSRRTSGRDDESCG